MWKAKKEGWVEDEKAKMTKIERRVQDEKEKEGWGEDEKEK